MPNPISGVWTAFSGLPDAVKAGGPVGVLLFAALVAGASGYWVYGSTYRAMVAERDSMRDERDDYRRIAWDCRGVVTQTAQKLDAASEQSTKVKPAIRLTSTEKQAITKPVNNPAELSQQIQDTKKVLAKIEPTPMPSPKKP
jgi:hypothetical protein